LPKTKANSQNVAVLMQDVVLLAVPFYPLKQDLARVTPAAELA
jgi:predicted dinucleotide-binding enzyme